MLCEEEEKKTGSSVDGIRKVTVKQGRKSQKSGSGPQAPKKNPTPHERDQMRKKGGQGGGEGCSKTRLKSQSCTVSVSRGKKTDATGDLGHVSRGSLPKKVKGRFGVNTLVYTKPGYPLSYQNKKQKKVRGEKN